MKVSIGAKIIDGPWGGGNLFFINLSNYLEKNGHKVVYDLKDPDIDVILLTDPRFLSESSSFNHNDIKKYKRFINNNVKVVHRINECDERKNTKGLNNYLIKANRVANYTVFVSSWLKDIFVEQGFESSNSRVILSGSNQDIFYSDRSKESGLKFDKLSIVTHHWGTNWNKGFDIYLKLDNLLEEKKWNRNFEFTYIGNLPKNFVFRNTKHILPLSGVELSEELKKSQIYLTASVNEPSGNHHIEGALCGLPILYINSGGIPEYCDGFGIKFNHDSFEESLNKMYLNYDYYKDLMKNYPFNSDMMCYKYLSLFEELLQSKKNITKKNVLHYLRPLIVIYFGMKKIVKKIILNDFK